MRRKAPGSPRVAFVATAPSAIVDVIARKCRLQRGAEMRTRTVSLACLIASLMGAALACAQELTLTRSAESGVDTRIAHERAWDRSCNALAITVSITKNPVNGTVAVAPGITSTLPANTPAAGNTGTCAGKTITGITLRYKSKSGFHGTDSVSYNVMSGGRPPLARVIIINVK